jgi:putative transposase
MQTPFVRGAFYHLYNRGIDGKDIFYSKGNYIYLLGIIKSSIKVYGVDLVAYCLMPNHYHFLARQQTDQPLFRWIQYLFNVYSQALNHQLERHGSLFQGRAKHIVVDQDAYLIHLTQYIHYNPVSSRLVASPEKWPYSNYLECIGKRHGTLHNPEFLSNYFRKPSDYQEYMDSYREDHRLVTKMHRYFLEDTLSKAGSL